MGIKLSIAYCMFHSHSYCGCLPTNGIQYETAYMYLLNIMNMKQFPSQCVARNLSYIQRCLIGFNVWEKIENKKLIVALLCITRSGGVSASYFTRPS